MEVADDVTSSVAVENSRMDVCVKFGDSRSKGFRDIRGTVFVSNEQTIRNLYPVWDPAFMIIHYVNDLACVTNNVIITQKRFTGVSPTNSTCRTQIETTDNHG